METTYYTLTAREILVTGAGVEKASGDGARQLVCVRRAAEERERAGAGKVIDLAAWKAGREEEARLEELWFEEADEIPEEPSAPVRRARRSHKSVLNLELWATLSVVAVMTALLVQIF